MLQKFSQNVRSQLTHSLNFIHGTPWLHYFSESFIEFDELFTKFHEKLTRFVDVLFQFGEYSSNLENNSSISVFYASKKLKNLIFAL